MRRNGYIVLLVAAVAWVTVAIVLGTGNPSGARAPVPPSGASPRCLPATLDHTAALAGTGLDVSPAPGTGSAGPHTQISFRGVPVTEIEQVAVDGSRSGHHQGHLYGYFQGDGGSFVPDKPFLAGERVSVSVVTGPAGGEGGGACGCAVPPPYPPDAIPGSRTPPAAASSYQSFVSAPGLRPPIL